MQLDRGEQAVFGYFNSREKASAAVAELRALGYNEIRLDEVPRSPRLDAKLPRGLYEFDHISGISYIDEFHSLAGPHALRMGSNLERENVHPADMSDGRRYMVTAVVAARDSDRVREVLRAMGALS